MDDVEDYFWRKPTEYQTYYDFRKLGYVNMTCVLIGILQYIFGMAVLLQKHMITPVNVIFMHYGSSLVLTSFSYVPRTYHELFRTTLCAIPEHNTYEWETISYYSFILAITFRHCAVWMAVMMGVWRYIAVIYPLKERQYCNMENTKKIIFAGYAFVPFTALPFFFGTGVGPAVKLLDQNGCLTTNFNAGKNVTIYEFQVPMENYPFWYYLAIGLLTLVVKVVSPALLAIISICLIKTLMIAKNHRKEMVSVFKRKNTYNGRMARQMRQQTDRITIALVVVLALFAVGELPHGICGTLTLVYGPKFFWKYWYPAMEYFNCLTYVSEMFNFLIYYFMSREFRTTFKALFNSNSNNGGITTPQTSISSLPSFKKRKDESTSRSSNIETISSSYT